MWFYTADTATRIAQQRHPRPAPRSADRTRAPRRTAMALRALADRLDAPRAPSGAHVADCG